MFDPVHIIKCIRNNWINQKDPLTSFIFPSITGYFDNTFPYNLATASFQDIRNRDLRYIRPMHQLCETAPRIKGRL